MTVSTQCRGTFVRQVQEIKILLIERFESSTGGPESQASPASHGRRHRTYCDDVITNVAGRDVQASSDVIAELGTDHEVEMRRLRRDVLPATFCSLRRSVPNWTLDGGTKLANFVELFSTKCCFKLFFVLTYLYSFET